MDIYQNHYIESQFLCTIFLTFRLQQEKTFYFQIQGQGMINYNKMFKQKWDKDEKFLKLKNTAEASLFLHSCRSQQLLQPQQMSCSVHQPKTPKISIKKMLIRNNYGSPSCSMLSETVKSVFKGSDQSSLIKVNSSPSRTIIDNPIILQKEEEKSFLQRQISIEPKKIRIFYGNQATQHIPSETINKIAEKKIMETLPLKNNDSGKSSIEKYSQQPIKKEIFNEFVSFGPKNLKKFKQFSQKEFDQCMREETIVQATERTQQFCQEIPEREGKRLSKTLSQFDIKKQLHKHGPSQINCERYFRQEIQNERSMFLTIKHAETMKNDFSSDHESQVLENYQSLIEQVKHNRLSNWSYESQFMDI